MTTTHDPVREALTDSDYVLALIDETFASVPEIKAHHERIRKIAARLAASPAVAAEVVETAVQFKSRLITEACSKWSGAQKVEAGEIIEWIADFRAMIQAAPPAPSGVKVAEADGVCVKCGVYPSEPCPMPDPDECIQRDEPAAAQVQEAVGARQKEWQTPPASWRLLAKAAIDLLCAVDEKHGTQQPPLKYAVPYGAVNDLRAALGAAKPTPEADSAGGEVQS